MKGQYCSSESNDKCKCQTNRDCHSLNRLQDLDVVFYSTKIRIKDLDKLNLDMMVWIYAQDNLYTLHRIASWKNYDWFEPTNIIKSKMHWSVVREHSNNT